MRSAIAGVALLPAATLAHVKNVSCPSGISAKVGVTFDCHFNAPDGTKYTVHMRITKVKGTSVGYFVNSFPS